MVVRTPDAWSGRFGMDDGYGESPGQSRSYDARKIDPVVRPRRASAIIALSRTPAPPAAAARISTMCQFVASSRRVDVIRELPAGAPRSAPLTASLPLPVQQVVEDILNHAEEIAVAEDGRSGEVTLLRLLKVRARLPRPAQTITFARTHRAISTPSTSRPISQLVPPSPHGTPRSPTPFPPTHPPGVRGCPPGTRPRPRGGHRLLPLPAQTLARPRSRLVGEIRTRAREARGGGRRDVRSIPTPRPRADQRA